MWSRRHHGSSTRSTVCCNCRNRRRREKCSSREYSRPRSSVCSGPSTASGRPRRNWSCRGWQYANLQERSARPAASHGASTGGARHERDLVSNATTAKPHVVHWPAAGYCCDAESGRLGAAGRQPIAHIVPIIERHLRGIISAIVKGTPTPGRRASNLHPADQAECLRLPQPEKFPHRHPTPLWRVGSVSPPPPDDQNCRRLLFNESVFRLFLYFGTLRLRLAQV